MAVDFEKIRLENKDNYGIGKGLTYLSQLYANRTHFIFELIQNAEDAGSTIVQFSLRQEGLIVRNNGRLFDHPDVKSICNIGESTGSDDYTRIGRFGIGFKSVYAYSNHPEIHSGEAHFRIDNYVMPYEVETKDPGKDWGSLFFLPFDREDVPVEEAINEIVEGLENIDGRTLLFLKKIQRLTWTTPTGDSRSLSRKEKKNIHGRLVTLEAKEEGQNHREYWQLFTRPVNPPEDTSVKNSESICVEAAFLLEKQADTENPFRIKKLARSDLVVFFPTTKATHLGFLLQGPYRTNPSRENIPSHDKWNKWLIEESGRLLSEALPLIRDMGLMRTEVLEALLPSPWYDPGIDDMFKPIVASVISTLYQQPLLPSFDGCYIAGRHAYIGRGTGLRSLFKTKQLKQLFGNSNPVKWLTDDISEDKTPDLRNYMIYKLKIKEIAPEEIAKKVSAEFFSMQTDKWMMQFYAFLLNLTALWRAPSTEPAGILRMKPLVRLENNKHVPPFKDDGLTPDVYLSHGPGSGKRVVKSTICADRKAREFLVTLGLTEPDRVSQILETIGTGYSGDSLTISVVKHTRDLNHIIETLTTRSFEDRERLILGLSTIPFIRASNAGSRESKFMTPSEVFSRHYDFFFQGNEEIWLTHEMYDEAIIQHLVTLGVQDTLVKSSQPDGRGFVIVSKSFGSHVRGLNSFDPECDVVGLEFAVEHPSLERSRFIWNEIAFNHKNRIHGAVERSRRQDYSDCRREETFSVMGELLADNPWLPDRSGAFHKPGELALHDLPPGFKSDRELAKRLSMTLDEVAELAAQIGLGTQEIDILKILPELPPEDRDEIFESIRARSVRPAKPIFPERPSADPERRRKRTQEETDGSPRKTFEPRPRSVRTSISEGDKDEYLKIQYTNEDEQLVCQICKGMMPFRKRNGEFYFESVEIANDYSKEHESYYLALCPVCSAMYREYVKRDEGALKNYLDLMDSIDETAELEIPVVLHNSHTTVRFTEQHIIDIKAIRSSEED